jgi:hypothetical protein
MIKNKKNFEFGFQNGDSKEFHSENHAKIKFMKGLGLILWIQIFYYLIMILKCKHDENYGHYSLLVYKS